MMQSCRSYEFHSTDNLHLLPPFLENPRGTRAVQPEKRAVSLPTKTPCVNVPMPVCDELRYTDVRRNSEVTFKELDNSDRVFYV